VSEAPAASKVSGGKVDNLTTSPRAKRLDCAFGGLAINIFLEFFNSLGREAISPNLGKRTPAQAELVSAISKARRTQGRGTGIKASHLNRL
jgi:hypothetical protein